MDRFNQIKVMIADIILIVVCVMLWRDGDYGYLGLLLFVWFTKLGGLEAWYPNKIKPLMKQDKNA